VPPQMQAIMGEAGQHTNKLLGTIRQRLKEAKQPTAPIVIRFFECGLVGTPIALINQTGGIDWPAISDPWGNIQQEYNPHGIEQNIRLPGQYHDRETDLYYNYRRYYDPKIGAYINQDPIGLDGGLNLYGYVSDPLGAIDPLGLAALSPEQIKDIVENNNNSSAPNETIECLIWKESSFNPKATTGIKGNTATGLMQMTKDAVNRVKQGFPSFKNISHSDMTNPTTAVGAGTAYLEIAIELKNGNIEKGLNKFGTGRGYSKSIQSCSKCLQEARKSQLGCKAEKKCFDKIHK